ncbi:ribbon-helix-helix domain-containing protein [Variovorax sp. CAN2819]|uniref:ribbon-helix-helix domain-containing protein n=1 Tax=Variovorax sp. CAN15 TaxID=3046727 RepID=UPI002648C493|nr:ribbon-helix-helix domain-containing protein [Variovorax sp. CAN15]MDN6884893.1 ribbon-helix-helix domain-containing protein [Variovorax sp. CAN15]
MCEVFISADPRSYDARTRSVRLHGVVTSIRLENLFWQVLEEIARRDDMVVVQLIERLYDELVAARGEVGNFASFLRVSALRYEALLAQGRIPADSSVAIRSLDAKTVLHELPEGWGRPLLQQRPAATAAQTSARVRTLHVAARRQA